MDYSRYKMTETDTHIFFLTGPYSNWHITSFDATLTPVGVSYRFNCGEKYMMASKAHMFGDIAILNKIMEASRPSDHKDFGRVVGGFKGDEWPRLAAPIWDKEARNIVFRACWHKIRQNEETRNYVLASGDKILVEASQQDRIWGVGLSWNNPAVLDPTNWNGTNWLGEAWMEARKYYRLFVEKPAGTVFDLWTKQFKE